MSNLEGILQRLRSALRALEDCLCPKGVKCLCCDEAPLNAGLCAECAAQLKRLRLRDAGDVRSVWSHRDAPRQLVLGLKYNCIEDCALPLADGLAEAAEDMALPADTVLTWVTMPEGRRRLRGIDHGRILCEAVAVRTGRKAEQLLERTRRVRPQRGLSSRKRRRNLKNSFACKRNIDTPVLLIDDVLTSGTTTNLCREVLLAAGAPCVFVLTATRAKARQLR